MKIWPPASFLLSPSSLAANFPNLPNLARLTFYRRQGGPKIGDSPGHAQFGRVVALPPRCCGRAFPPLRGQPRRFRGLKRDVARWITALSIRWLRVRFPSPSLEVKRAKSP